MPSSGVEVGESKDAPALTKPGVKVKAKAKAKVKARIPETGKRSVANSSEK